MPEEYDPIREFLESPIAAGPPRSSMAGALDVVPTAQTNSPMDLGGTISSMLPGQELRDLSARQEAEYLKANQLDNVPLDTQSGASSWERFMLSFMRDQENQVKYLQKRYGEDRVRLDTTGDLIVRATDVDTGKDRDIKVHERGLSAKDFIDLAGTVPEIAASIVAIRQGRKVPFMNKGVGQYAKDVVTGAIGAETAGAAKDVLASSYQDRDPNLQEIASARGKQAVVDMALGAGTYGLGRVAKKMQNPLASSRTEVEQLGRGAEQHFQRTAPEEMKGFKYTAGESTGSPAALRTEAFYEELPGGAGPLIDFKKKQEGILRKLQMKLEGKTPETDEEFTRRMVNELGIYTEAAESGVQKATEGLQKTATSEIEDVVSGLTLPQKLAHKSETGRVVRDAVVAKRDFAKAEADRLYDAVEKASGGTGKVFDVNDLADKAQKILDSLPTKGSIPMNDFAPPDVVNRLKEMASLKGTAAFAHPAGTGGRQVKLSLSDLRQMRRDTLEAIPRNEGAPGRGAHYLGEIADAITESIESNVSKMPKGDLKAALESANKHYREQVVPFNRVGITELFRNAEEGGFVPNDQIVARLFQGDKVLHNYQMLRETLGPSSGEFRMLKRTVADNILDNSREIGNDFIDPEKFIKNMSAFRGKNSEIADDIFGPQFNKMIRTAKALKAGYLTAEERAKAGLGGSVSQKVSGSEFLDLMKDSNPTVQKLNELIKAEALRDNLYKNSLLRSVADGRLPGKSVNPTEFVNRFLNDSTLEETKQVMGIIGKNPQLTEDIRAKTVEKLFRDAERSATADDLAVLMSADKGKASTHMVTSMSLARQLKGDRLNKIAEVLGPEITEDVRQFINLINPMTKKELTYQAAGGIAAGGQVAKLWQQPLKYFDQAVHNFLFANILVRKPLRDWLTHHPSSADPQNVLLLLSNPYMVENIVKEFGQGAGSEEIVGSMRRGLDEWWKREGSKQQKPKDIGPVDVFLNSPPVGASTR